MVKVKIGLDENVLDLLNIGNVNRIVKHPIKVYQKKHLTGKHNILQSLGPNETVYQVEGLINQNVDNNIAKLLSLYHSQQPVALETDSFTVFGKITDLEIPYDAGQLWRRYRLQLTEIPFWGTTLINKGKKAFLADLNLQYKTKQIFPTQANHNFQLDRENKKFSFEFILVNELEETDSFNCLWDDNQTSFWSIIVGGSGSLSYPTVADVTSPVKHGNNAYKISWDTTGTYGWIAINHDFDPPQDWSGYDFLCLWWYGDGSGHQIRIHLKSNIENNYGAYWDVNIDWNGWRRIILSLRKPTGEASGPLDLNNIKRIQIRVSTGGFAKTWYLDRGGLDVGNWVKCEIQIPDNLKNGYHFPIAYSWDGSAWKQWIQTLKNAPNLNVGELYTLNGENIFDIYGLTTDNDCGAAYTLKNKSETVTLDDVKDTDGVFRVDPDAYPFTYTQTYGCQKRIGFAIKMPPWTGCDDLESLFAINKVKLKIEIYYEKEKTTYYP